jgi:DNA-binding transcriptional LysR family regulator
MDRLLAMQVFATVAECGSFTAAAERLDLSRAMATRHVESLEQWLGARLLHRTTRRVSLTDAGAQCLRYSQQMLALADEVQSEMRPGDSQLRGLRTPAGKLVRSLPALADEALRPQWEAAAARLKTLAKGIKAVLQQQAPRLQSCLMLGRHWPLDTWRRLFLEHPLLRVVAQVQVWKF